MIQISFRNVNFLISNVNYVVLNFKLEFLNKHLRIHTGVICVGNDFPKEVTWKGILISRMGKKSHSNVTFVNRYSLKKAVWTNISKFIREKKLFNVTIMKRNSRKKSSLMIHFKNQLEKIHFNVTFVTRNSFNGFFYVLSNESFQSHVVHSNS